MWVDIVRGTGTILIIVILAGAIAYVGDRVGHQVGRKRLTLFGIRPRYTSTIVAIGTGMLIAFTVTMIAILASQQVKTAFFKLNRINSEISDLQSRQKELERKVNSGRLIVPNDALLVPSFAIIRQNDSASERLARVLSFYSSSVRYINGQYPQYGLKPFKTPPDIDKRLSALVEDPKILAQLAIAPVVLMIGSDQNLYEGDQIHFQLNATPDSRRFSRGEDIKSLSIPGGQNASSFIAIRQLQQYVANVGGERGLPPYIASNVQVFGTLPGAAQMQSMLSHPGKYYLTAYAAADVYPHTGGIPIEISLVAAK
ncbi:MAG: DUF3084 domain-containing protein [Candidatus Eremiobacteraeota bacterium]|nr:DUF3084 domain-containing protein [Candidatus Eremiobacteraeota bacterium]